MPAINTQRERQSDPVTLPNFSHDQQALIRLFFFSFAICFIAHAYHVFTFPLTIDGEVFAFTDHPSGFLSNKRWTAEILARLLIPRSTIPIVPDLLAITASAAAYTLTASTWRIKICIEHYVAAPLALIFPIFFEVMLFPSFSYGVSIGVLLAALGVWFLARDTTLGYSLAFASICTAAGVYQPISIYPLSSFVVLTALRIAHRGCLKSFRYFYFGIVTIISATITSYLIGTAISLWCGYSSAYIENFFRFDMLVEMPDRVLLRTAALGAGLLSGTGKVFIEGCTPYATFLTLAFVLGLAAAATAENKVHALASKILLISGIGGSIGVAAINGGDLPLRTLLGLPIALAGLVFWVTGEWGGARRWSRAARWSLVLGSAWCFLAFATIGSRIYYSAYVTWLNDRGLAQEIIDRINALPSLDRSKAIHIELSGYHVWPRSQMVPDLGGNPAGSSFFGWDEGIIERVIDFLKTLGRLDLQAASPEEHAKLSSIIARLPDWPSPGSVSLIDNVVVIKFGKYSNVQR